MKKLFFLWVYTVGMLYILPVNAQESSSEHTELQGRWEVTQVTVESNTDGKIKEDVYKSASKVKSIIPCPQEWEFKDSETVVLRYPDGREDTMNYAMDNEQLSIPMSGALLFFNYSVNGDNLMLTVTVGYDSARSKNKIDYTVENWTINLQKMQVK
jgi:hypothetical protein